MKECKKNQKGITLIALVLTIIVLSILAGVSIGEASKRKNSVREAKDVTAFSELTKIQQAILERYIKYKQFGNINELVGEKLEYTYVQNLLNEYEIELKVNSIDADDDEYKYYKLDKEGLKTLGLSNIHNNDEFIVNYSSGEVFNKSKKKATNGTVLYIEAYVERRK